MQRGSLNGEYYKLTNVKSKYRPTPFVAKKFNPTNLPLLIQDKDEYYHALLESENVVRIHEIFEETQKIHILERIEGGSLLDIIKHQLELDTCMPHHQVFTIMNRLFDILEFLHTNGVWFNGFRPNNLVFTKEDDLNSMKIMNFETAVCKSQADLMNRKVWSKYNRENSQRILNIERNLSRVGHKAEQYCSVRYAAPEILLHQKSSYESDIWSVGVIFYSLLTNSHPLEYIFDVVDKSSIKNNLQFILRLNQGDFIKFDHPNLKNLDSEVLSLLKKMLKVDPVKRVKISKIDKMRKSLNGLTNLLKMSKASSIETMSTEESLDYSNDSPRIIENSYVSKNQLKHNVYSSFSPILSTDEELEEYENIFISSWEDSSSSWTQEMMMELLEVLFEDEENISTSNFDACKSIIKKYSSFNKDQFIGMWGIIKNIMNPNPKIIQMIYEDLMLKNFESDNLNHEDYDEEIFDMNLSWEKFETSMMS